MKEVQVSKEKGVKQKDPRDKALIDPIESTGSSSNGVTTRQATRLAAVNGTAGVMNANNKIVTAPINFALPMNALKKRSERITPLQAKAMEPTKLPPTTRAQSKKGF